MNTQTEHEAPPDEIRALAEQVMTNCHLSDALHAGSFSLCGLLLRLRDYYKWDLGLEPWQGVDSPEVLSWIEERENFWEELDGGELKPLEWRGREIDPFDVGTINADLAEYGYYYGAGLAAFMKPSFFLGRLLRDERLGDFRVVYIGWEAARDLFTAPAQTREGVIIARRRPMAAHLWDTVLHAGAGRRWAVDVALGVYGLSRSDLDRPTEEWIYRLDALLDREIDVYVRHEYGEAMDRIFPRDRWQLLVGGNPRSRIELMARTIKDLLADTGEDGRLAFIVKEHRLAALALYVSQLDGLPELLFPEMKPAFERFVSEKDWGIVEGARRAGWTKGREMAERMLALAERRRGDSDGLAVDVEESFYRPLKL
jgi:hypothetical protein